MTNSVIYLPSWWKILGFELGYTIFRGVDVHKKREKFGFWNHVGVLHSSALKHDESRRGAMSFP